MQRACKPRALSASAKCGVQSGSANGERATGDDCEYEFVGRAVAALCAPEERIFGQSSRHAHSFSILTSLFTCFFSSLTCKWLTHIRARQSAPNAHLLKSSVDRSHNCVECSGLWELPADSLLCTRAIYIGACLCLSLSLRVFERIGRVGGCLAKTLEGDSSHSTLFDRHSDSIG